MAERKNSRKAKQATGSQPTINETSINQAATNQAAVNQTTVDESTVQSVDQSTLNRPSIEHSNVTLDNSESNSCVLCGLETGDYIVQCDKCGKWYHFECVQLEEIGEDDPWSCFECLSKHTEFDKSSQSKIHQQNSAVTDNDRKDLSQSSQYESVNQGVDSNSQKVPNSVTEVKSSGQSNSQGEIDLGMSGSASNDQQNLSSATVQTHVNRFSSSFNQLERAKTSTVRRYDQQVPKVVVHKPSRPIRGSLENLLSEARKVPSGTKSLQSWTEKPSIKNTSISSLPVYAASQPHKHVDNDQTINQNPRTSKPNQDDKVSSIRSQRSSSKTISSSKSRNNLEQIRLQEELDLQKELDEARINLELKALAMKEAREKKFLEEKFKALESGASDSASTITTKTTKTKQSSHSQLSNKTDLIAAWVKNQRQQISQTTPSDVRVRRFNSKIDHFNFDYSIPVEDYELKSFQEKYSKAQEAGAGEFHTESEKWNQKAQLLDSNQKAVNSNIDNDDQKARPFIQNQRKVNLENDNGVQSLPKRQQPENLLKSEHVSQQPECQDTKFQKPESQETRFQQPVNQGIRFQQEWRSQRPFSQNTFDPSNQKSTNQHSTNTGLRNPSSADLGNPLGANFKNPPDPERQNGQSSLPKYNETYQQVPPPYQQDHEFVRPPNNQFHKPVSPPYEQNQQSDFWHQSVPPLFSQNHGSTHQQQQYQSNQSVPPSFSQNQGSTHHQQNQSIPPSNQQNFGNIPPNQSHQSQYVPYQQNNGQNLIGNQIGGPQMSSAYQNSSQRLTLTTNQIAARHVVAKKLPHFNGNPAEWPDFIQKYENTTETCGFNNGENLDRLSECLKDPARAIVKSQLSMPECVPSIIETLRQKYGRPEIVVRAVLSEIRKEPPIKADKLEALSNFGYRVQNVCHTIQRQQMHFYLYNPELVQDMVEKLPHQTKIEWARYSDQLQQVTLATLSEWLVALSRSLNRITIPEIPVSSGDRSSDRKSDRKSETSMNSGNKKSENWLGTTTSKGAYVNAHEANNFQKSGENSKCPLCKKSCKNLGECPTFKGLTVEERWKFVYDHNKICRGCLRPHGRKCTILRECGVNGCTYKHHSILHNHKKHSKDKQNVQSSENKSKPADDKSKPDGTCNAHGGGQAVLYKILPVKLKFGNKTLLTFAYMDDGSGLTLLESELAEELGLKGVPESLCLRWTSGTIRHEKESMRVAVEVSGVENDQHNYPMRDVRTVKLLDLPMQRINRDSLIKRYPYLERVPFQDFEAKPRILIGLDNVKLGLSREYVEGGWQEPVISKTLLGWVVHGPNGPASGAENQHMQHHVLSISCNECPCQPDRDQELHKQIEEFFSLENFGTRALTSSVESKEVQRARKIMEETTIRKNGRFETGLLWKFDDIMFPNNFQMAMKRLECQERRLQANRKLMDNINNQIESFIVKGYIRKLTPQEVHTEDKRTTYLPLFHHLDPKKPEKVRMVWDAAAQFKGVSLNSMLLTGPDDFVALPDVLRRFREKRIAIGGDIEEMYHQVAVRQEDQNSQRFLWRNGNSDVAPDVYVMQVLTFGSTCSPSLAQFVKNKNASEFETKYPKAANAIKKNHYIDDWLDGQDTVEETIRLAKDVRFVHRQGGFKLRKFISNSPEVLEALGEDKEQQSKELNVSKTSGTQRVLGMWWDTQIDCFMYSLKFTKLNEEVLLGLRAPTKRETLKTLMSIFDPLGLIAFFLVYLKMLLQEIWKAQLGWDEQLPKCLNEKWNKWIKLLPSVEEVRIPRLYSRKLASGSLKSVELHTFVDAGENAYCATCYLRIVDSEGVDCVLVEAKTKVAPIKPLLTIPRLELLAAVLGTRLAKSVGESLSIKIDKRVFWSDSRDVLCWIRSINRKYRQFVAFRVGEILETSKEVEWRFVPGKLNPADDGTKWSKKPNFSQNSRWYSGPEFLWEDPSSWPKDLSREETTNEEIHVHLQIMKTDPPSKIVPERFSRWSRMVNAQALSTRYVNKLIARVLKEKETPVGPLKHHELKEAEYTLYKLAQFDCFFEEITTLKSMKQKYGDKAYINKSSSIYKCSPYLEEDGLLRIRGRIDNIRNVKFDTKRPIILPKNHAITKLVVDSYHRIYLHQNNDTVLNELRQKYYIPRLRVVLKRVISECQMCKNKRSKPKVPEMGDLPVARLSPGFRPFTHTGVDYFGPIDVTVNRGVQKRWGVLFTCLTIRAIHIEIASSLNTNSCILCIRNFVNTRGTPAEFYSDNGSNMKSADKVLREEFEKIDKEMIESTFTTSYTKWNFNPPASPHMAGAWERLIGSVKSNLKPIMPTRTPTEELLRSFLLEVVNIVNSRPLTYLEIESSDDETLTPNHFLLGSSNGNKAPGEFPYEEKTLTNSWRKSQELTNMFWRRWIKEYLPTLTRRSKWFPKQKPIEVGDVVLLVDEKNARNCYPKGTVLEAMPDKQGQVRQALVRTTEVIPGKVGETKDAAVRIKIKLRPVAKIAVLDVAGKEVKPIETQVNKGLTKGENVTNGNTTNVTDKADEVNPKSNPAKKADVICDKRKLENNLKRRSSRIAAKANLK